MEERIFRAYSEKGFGDYLAVLKVYSGKTIKFVKNHREDGISISEWVICKNKVIIYAPDRHNLVAEIRGTPFSIPRAMGRLEKFLSLKLEEFSLRRKV